jgi:hypothetical protein
VSDISEQTNTSALLAEERNVLLLQGSKNKGLGHVFVSRGLYSDEATSTGTRRVFRHVFTGAFSSAVDTTDRSKGFGA